MTFPLLPTADYVKKPLPSLGPRLGAPDGVWEQTVRVRGLPERVPDPKKSRRRHFLGLAVLTN